jgi:AraC family transcriptional regulator of adaptative response/methylated-DNA-[protein]-cysteine methyltransferase
MIKTQFKSETLSLNSRVIETPLGDMIAMADEESLFSLEFTDRTKLTQQITSFKKAFNVPIVPGNNSVLEQISNEICAYFEGKCLQFKTPIKLVGTPFQQKVWQALMQIPLGITCSYLDLANVIKHPTACRAVALANSANRMSIIIPCHRVINHNGQLGGYASGLERKQWLLEFERNLIGR